MPKRTSKKLTPAQRFAQKGGKARAKALSPTERSEAARKAVNVRWKAYRAKQGVA